MLRLKIMLIAFFMIALPPINVALAQPTENRVALVMGNAAYGHADALRNPVNDARAMADVLRATGFEVILRENSTRRAMTEALREFASKITPGGVALFYCAGHGVQVRGANYLLPVDAAVASEDELKYEAIDVNDILGRLDEARVRLSLVILDACRDNPFPRRFRSSSRGLAQLDAPRGTMIAYATAPGETAADGDGANGLYTEELLKAIAVPGLELEDVFKRAIDGVAQRSGNKQTPWVSSSFRGEFFFMNNVTIVLPPGTTPPVAGEQPQLSAQAIEHAAWGAIAASTSPAAFELFLKRFPDGNYADFARHRLEELRKLSESAPPTRQATVEEEKRAAEQAEQTLALNDAQRRRTQAALTIKGFDTGGANGVFNPRTRQMIANYQRSRNEPATGFLSAPQYAALIKETQDAVAKQEEDRKRAEAERQRNAPVPAPAAMVVPPASRSGAASPAPAIAQGANRFDGTWTATIQCQGDATGARGYTMAASGRVNDGAMHLSRGSLGEPNSLAMTGRIAPDGSATLQATGKVGNSIYATNGASSGTPFAYVVSARFDGARGSGQRLGSRACDITFARQ